MNKIPVDKVWDRLAGDGSRLHFTVLNRAETRRTDNANYSADNMVRGIAALAFSPSGTF